MNEDPYNNNQDRQFTVFKKDKGSYDFTIQDYKPIMTFILIGINALVFILETLSGGSEKTDVLLKYGAQYAPYILNDGEWYRVFTSMFVHIGIEHIMGNMICLIAVGQYIEVYFGRIKYMVIYILSGLCGNLLSLFADMYSTGFAVSAGASGAISGLIGSLVVLAIDRETRKLFPLKRVLIALVIVLIPAKANVNVLAHLGGMVGGFAVGYTLYYFSNRE